MHTPRSIQPATPLSSPRRPGWAALLMGVFLTSGGLFGAVSSWQVYHLEQRIMQQGPRVTGHLLGKQSLGDGEYQIRYEFPLPDGRQQPGSRMIEKSLWQSMQPGQPLLVAYAPDDPGRSLPPELSQPSAGVHLYVGAIAAFVGLLGAVLLRAALLTFVRRARQV